MKTKNIVVVEDEGIVSIDIRNMLTRMGYSISGVAFSGKEAVTLAESTPCDLILMDIGLKGECDGIEAARKIGEKFSIPIIFLTGFADQKTLKRAQEVNPSGYILKPIQEDELKKAIAKSLS